MLGTGYGAGYTRTGVSGHADRPFHGVGHWSTGPHCCRAGPGCRRYLARRRVVGPRRPGRRLRRGRTVGSLSCGTVVRLPVAAGEVVHLSGLIEARRDAAAPLDASGEADLSRYTSSGDSGEPRVSSAALPAPLPERWCVIRESVDAVIILPGRQQDARGGQAPARRAQLRRAADRPGDRGEAGRHIRGDRASESPTRCRGPRSCRPGRQVGPIWLSGGAWMSETGVGWPHPRSAARVVGGHGVGRRGLWGRAAFTDSKLSTRRGVRSPRSLSVPVGRRLD